LKFELIFIVFILQINGSLNIYEYLMYQKLLLLISHEFMIGNDLCVNLMHFLRLTYWYWWLWFTIRYKIKY